MTLFGGIGMNSYVAMTDQIDEPDLAAQLLYDQIRDQGALLKNSAGILICNSDMEVAQLAELLAEKLSFPIIGGTTIASMDHVNGFHESAVTLLVLTADDCCFSVACSEPIIPEQATAQVEQTYRAAAAGLEEEVKLLFVIPPYQLDVMLDIYADVFNQIAPGVPAIGGLPSYHGKDDLNVTIFNGQTYADRMVLLAVSGMVRPFFSVQTVHGADTSKKRQITKAEDNVVYQVGNQTFAEYLEEAGLPVDMLCAGNSTITFTANPFMVEENREEFGDAFTYLRALHALDRDSGAGIAIGRVPEGGSISLCPLNRERISIAAEQGVVQLKEQIAEIEREGYRFSTLFAVSCVGRYVLMSPDSAIETTMILGGLSEGMALAGFYSYGEICPLPGKQGPVVFAHNESLTLCAF